MAKGQGKLEDRIIGSLVFGTERLVDQCLWADPDSGELTLADEIILTGGW